MTDLSYNVRVRKILVRHGKHVSTYTVRWVVGDESFREPFRHRTQADGFRSELLSAARRGEPFDTATGRPISWNRSDNDMAWYDFALHYATEKWPHVSGNHRRSIAEALTDATEVLLSTTKNRPPNIREALRWSFSVHIRETVKAGADPLSLITTKSDHVPERLGSTIRWLRTTTVAMSEFSDPKTGTALARKVLNRIKTKLDGTPAGGNTANRKKMVLNNAFNYGWETGIIPENPLTNVQWKKPLTVEVVDPSVVPNPEQAEAILTEVGKQGELGERLVVFFACIYYAAMRPEEISDLRKDNIPDLPAPDGETWGEFLLTNADPEVGRPWTDDGTSRQRRALKHRAPGEKRRPPIHPELVAHIHQHVARFGYGRGGRLVTGPRGGIVRDSTYLPVWHTARERALTKTEAASSLAARPYDLRHACVSTWLAAGVNPSQVAAWVGNSVHVLLNVYAKCIAGQETEARRRILDATRPPSKNQDASKTSTRIRHDPP